MQLGYVSLALGHSDVAVTARHYARWAGGDDYREPLALEWGEVPPELLARLRESQKSPTTNETAAGSLSLTDGRYEGIWRAQHDSNMRPSGPQVLLPIIPERPSASIPVLLHRLRTARRFRQRPLLTPLVC